MSTMVGESGRERRGGEERKKKSLSTKKKKKTPIPRTRKGRMPSALLYPERAERNGQKKKKGKKRRGQRYEFLQILVEAGWEKGKKKGIRLIWP